jgi:prolipoprotein diacylglyceryl transferase
MQQPLAYIPSPSRGLIHLGPLPLRGYALMIILGVVAAVWLGERRWAARGGTAGTVVDVAVWAVPFGLVGGRLYHVITDYQLYFGKEWHVARVFEVWKGGLGIWGAIAAGALGAYLGCRRRGVSLRTFADAAAPGIALAQALGRWGNWFNQELYGRPTKLPWAVKIDPAHRVSTPDIGTYHPTFLYESLWCIGVAVLVIWAEKRFRLAYGRTFALYVAAYTVGRAWIEWLRVDSAHHILGLRLNDWTSLIVFLAAVAYLYYYRDRTEIPEGAVGPAASEPGAEPVGTAETPAEAGEPADTAAESTADTPTTSDESGAAEEPVVAEDSVTATAAEATDASDTADESAAGDAPAEVKDPAAEGEPAATAGQSTAEAADASATTDAAGTTDEPGVGEKPGAAEEAAPAKKPARARKPAAAKKPAAAPESAAEVVDAADASKTSDAGPETPGGAATEAEETAPAAETNGHGASAEPAEPGESAESSDPGEADHGKDDGRAKASAGAEPVERKS